MDSKQYVTYLRVSTDKQQQSGLGLGAQKLQIRQFLQNTKSTQVKEFIEAESGKNASRPQLIQAIALCKSKNYTLLIAKLDRLSRDVGFIFWLRGTGIQFRALDIPEDANTLTLGMVSVFSQHERELISIRTKMGLAEAKARGVKLGPRRPFDNAMQKKAKITRMANYKKQISQLPVALMALSLRKDGLTLRQISSKLVEIKLSDSPVCISTIARWIKTLK